MEREAVTIRIPAHLLQQAKQLRESSESFNEMVVEAIAHEVRRRRSLAAHQRIVARSAEVEAQTGMQSSSLDLIRHLRAGEERRD
ncbi:YlcI/YnfO family protein [Anabaena cylindrica UHCC 0172]|uniref:YlcI/YnfO family protein n=1 Tax=Anabaena cylindrica TaxID=1165 RepID=UPI002B20670D|nr:YlcI/YnfO family protein [Anabaena cylindrica]MEA5553946.1 YlcI/YnfO family protein [Anabaena cylindrica UHCC 0172]